MTAKVSVAASKDSLAFSEAKRCGPLSWCKPTGSKRGKKSDIHRHTSKVVEKEELSVSLRVPADMC